MPCLLLVLNALPCPDREKKCDCGCNIVGIAAWLCGEGLRRALQGVPMARVLQRRARTAAVVAGEAAPLTGEKGNYRAQKFWESCPVVFSAFWVTQAG